MTAKNRNYLAYRNELTRTARTLRKKMPEPERRLWFAFLRGHRLRFLRQKPIANYIVDFYCSGAALVIELDGESHIGVEAARRDAVRTRYLQQLGITVLRFTNQQVMDEFDSVCESIDKALVTRLRK